jgi:hypothetical protein
VRHRQSPSCGEAEFLSRLADARPISTSSSQLEWRVVEEKEMYGKSGCTVQPARQAPHICVCEYIEGMHKRREAALSNQSGLCCGRRFQVVGGQPATRQERAPVLCPRRARLQFLLSLSLRLCICMVIDVFAGAQGVSTKLALLWPPSWLPINTPAGRRCMRKNN